MLFINTVAEKISMWGFKETDDSGDSCMRTWVQYDVGLFTQGPVKVIVPQLRFSTCLLFTPTAAAVGWLLKPPHSCYE